MMEWAPASGMTIKPPAAADLLVRAVRRVDDANHDSSPRLQWHAFETSYQKPPHAMRDLWKLVARAFGLVWFAEGYPVVWYHYGGSSRLRVELATYCARSLWKMCERYTRKENLKQGITDNAEGIAFNNATRTSWVAELGELTPTREIEEWASEAWRVERARERARHRDPDAFVPRSMSYEQVSRWLDDVIEASPALEERSDE